MPTKEQMSREVNEALGTELEFDRMLADDLELLHELATEGKLMEPQAKQYVKKHGKAKLEEEIDSWHIGKYVLRLM